MKRRSQNPRRESKKRTKRRSSEITREKVRPLRKKVKNMLDEEAMQAVGMSPASAKAFLKTMKGRVRSDSCGCDGGKCGCKTCKTKRKKQQGEDNA